MLIVFALDTSASTAARSAAGLSVLDCAKGAVEHFVKVCGCGAGVGKSLVLMFQLFSLTLDPPLPQVRALDPASATDTYALTTCDAACALAAFDRSPPATPGAPPPAFAAALRAAHPARATAVGTALRAAFDTVALVRAAAGADTYGAGFTPAAAVPAVVALVTDGGAPSDVPPSCDGGGPLALPPGAPVPGGDLTRQPYRWDTRLFTVSARLPGVSVAAGPPDAGVEDAGGGPDAVAALALATGGAASRVSSLRGLLAWADGLAAAIAGTPPLMVGLEVVEGGGGGGGTLHVPAVGLRFRGSTTPPRPSTDPLWPLPDAVAPGERGALPPRDAHPLLTVLVEGGAVTVAAPPGFPVDVYEVARGVPPALATRLATAAAAATAHDAPSTTITGWPVHVRSADGGLGDACALLHPAPPLPHTTTAPLLRLTVLPYNFGMVFRLLTALTGLPSGARLAPPPAWRADLARCVAAAPPSYRAPLRAALARINLPAHLVPADPHDGGLPPSLATALRRAAAGARADVDAVAARCAAAAAAFTARPPAVGGDPAAVPPGVLIPQLAAVARALRAAVVAGAPPPPATTTSAAVHHARGGRYALPVALMGDFTRVGPHGVGGEEGVHGTSTAPPPPPPLRDPFAEDGGDASLRAGGAFGNPYARSPSVRSPRGGGTQPSSPGRPAPPATDAATLNLLVDEALGEAATLLERGPRRPVARAPAAAANRLRAAPPPPQPPPVATVAAATPLPPPQPGAAPPPISAAPEDAAAADAAWAAMLAARGGAPAPPPAARRTAKRLRRGCPRPPPDGCGRDALVDALLAYHEAALTGGAEAAAALAATLRAPAFVGDGPVWAAALAARAEEDGVPGLADALRAVAQGG